MNLLLQEMLSNADPSQVAGLSRFFKTGPGQYGEGDKFLGIKVPVTREVVRRCWNKIGFREIEECINNWDLVDLSCYPLLGEWLLDKDRSVLYSLAREGKTIWEQRIGIVSTMTFIRHGTMPRTMLRYAIEKFPPEERAAWLHL